MGILYPISILVFVFVLTFMMEYPRYLLKPFRVLNIAGADGSVYMRRYYLLKTRWGSIYLHEILRDDEDEFHDHPWNFVSVILRGGYIESEPYIKGSIHHKFHRRRLFNIIRHKAEDAHKISLFETLDENRTPRYLPITAWTLVFVGPKRRDWGFHVHNGDGTTAWVQWEKYMDIKFGAGKWRN